MCLTTRLINGFLITCEDLFVGFKDFKLVNLEKPRLVSYIVSNYVYHFKNGWAIPNNVNQAIINAFYSVDNGVIRFNTIESKEDLGYHISSFPRPIASDEQVVFDIKTTLCVIKNRLSNADNIIANVNQAILNAFYYDSRYSFPVTLFVGFKEEHLQKVGQEVVVVSTFTIISPFQADSILKNIYDYICRLTTNQEINEEIATLCRDISFLYCIVYNNIQPAMRGVYND